MTKRELEKYKILLIKKREELVSNVGHITGETRRLSQKDAAGDLSGYTLHMADMASDNYEREFSLNLASGEHKTLIMIDEALKRIKENNYGKCLSCEKKISKRRLAAIPHAQLCIPCKKKEEEK
ncbi:MAG: TraR/DksA C4-type zinc finger protein [Candidatus Omnitrophica bacterium]|nr:TraR/DksA C4-type zinc finger protein [Candidatus Omnitrophota bacterium]